MFEDFNALDASNTVAINPLDLASDGDLGLELPVPNLEPYPTFNQKLDRSSKYGNMKNYNPSPLVSSTHPNLGQPLEDGFFAGFQSLDFQVGLTSTVMQSNYICRHQNKAKLSLPRLELPMPNEIGILTIL